MQQVSLMMAGQEPVDLMMTMPMDAASMTVLANNNQLMDITDLIEEYAPELKEDLRDLLKGCIVNGKLYAVPVDRCYATALSVFINKDILDALDLVDQAEAINSWDDMTALFDEILSHEEYANMTPMIPGPGPCFISRAGSLNATESFDDIVTYDPLGDSTKLVGVIGESDQVVNIFATPEYKAMIDKMVEYNAKGYVYKDSITNASETRGMMKLGHSIAYFVDTEFGNELTAAATMGNVIRKVVVDYPISTSSVNKFTYAIPSHSKEPEAAITFLSMWYHDARISNLMCLGIEGQDYVIGADGIAAYPEGVQSGEVYHHSEALMPNFYNILPWEGMPADFRQEAKAASDATPISKYMGFVIDSEPISNQIAAVSVVINEYLPTLECGFGDDALYEEFLAKLEANGASDIIAEYQRQLDAWLAE